MGEERRQNQALGTEGEALVTQGQQPGLLAANTVPVFVVALKY